MSTCLLASLPLEYKLPILIKQLTIDQDFRICAQVADHVPVDRGLVARSGFALGLQWKDRGARVLLQGANQGLNDPDGGVP